MLTVQLNKNMYLANKEDADIIIKADKGSSLVDFVKIMGPEDKLSLTYNATIDLDKTYMQALDVYTNLVKIPGAKVDIKLEDLEKYEKVIESVYFKVNELTTTLKERYNGEEENRRCNPTSDRCFV